MRKPLSPLQAFAEDVQQAAVRRVDLGDDAMGWMSILQTAESVAASHGRERSTVLAEAELALAEFAQKRPSMVHDALPQPSDPLGRVAELLRSAAEEMERSGCFELAYATVSAVCRLTAAADYVSASLATLHLGRVARQMNDHAVAKDCYEAMLSRAVRQRDGPLAARGHIGLALLHDMKGNMPAAESEYKKALRMATPMGGAFASASQGLMSIALTRGQLADALLYGWNVYDASERDAPVRAGVLGELAGVALGAGFAEQALQGYLHASQLSDVPRLHMVVASGVIRAAARLGDHDLMRLFDQRMLRDIDRANLPHSAAMCLLYAAEAWGLIAEMPTARARLDQGRALAEQHGYFEYVFRSDAIADAWRNSGVAGARSPASQPSSRTTFLEAKLGKAVMHGIDRLRTVGA